MSTERCLIHNVDETDRPGDYRPCLECGHIFRTEEELLAAHNEMLHEALALYPGAAAVADAVAGDEIYSCPHCTHDW